MFLKTLAFDAGSKVSEIVEKDYRTADVFLKYGIEYCCGGKWPLETVCMMKGIDFTALEKELHQATRSADSQSRFNYQSWNTDFLIDYILNIHHDYLKLTLPELGLLLADFAMEHRDKYPHFELVSENLRTMSADILEHLLFEENNLFPYIRRIAHVYESRDDYARLLVRTMRKPVEDLMEKEHEMVRDALFNLRGLTNNYTAPGKVCTNHIVVLSKLRELDNNLSQHLYIENEVLFPRALEIERTLLNSAG